MTLSDISFWGTYSFISVIIALFVVEFIEGGSATHLGLSSMVYSAIAAILSIPIGRFFDKHKGYLDEVWGLSFASAATGVVYIWLSFATDLWQLYLAMALLGAVSVINTTSWRILFFNNIDKKEYGETVGIYQTLMSIGEGMALALGGIMGDIFGFEKVVFYGGVVILFGSLIPIGIKSLFKKRKG